MKSLFLVVLLTLSACSSVTKDDSSRPSAIISGVRVASLNYRIEGGKTLNDIFNHLEPFVAEAVKNKAKYILIPELIVLDLFSVNPEEEEVRKELDKTALLAQDYLSRLTNIAAKYDVSIIGASYIVKKGNHFINRAVYIRPGEAPLFQDKVHPTPWEIRYGFKGSGGIQEFSSKDFNFAILICHDAEFPGVSTSLIFKRPEVLFVPSQTDDVLGFNRVLYTSSARAIEHMAYVVMTGTSSLKDAPWHTYEGRNVFLRPQNKYFPQGYEKSSLEEELSYYDLDLSKLRESRRDLKQVYPARDFKRL